MMRVVFNEIEEYLQELKDDCLSVDRSIVRATIRRRWSGVPVLLELSVASTCVVAGNLVELCHKVGAGYQFGDELDSDARDAMRKARALLAHLSAVLTTLGLTVRPGHLSESPAGG